MCSVCSVALIFNYSVLGSGQTKNGEGEGSALSVAAGNGLLGEFWLDGDQCASLARELQSLTGGSWRGEPGAISLCLACRAGRHRMGLFLACSYKWEFLVHTPDKAST